MGILEDLLASLFGRKASVIETLNGQPRLEKDTSTQRRVLLPHELDTKLTNLTDLNEESNGILLYSRQGNLCPITNIFITAIGSEGRVQASPERIAIANEFFRTNPSHQYVKFHTHSRGTVERFGQHYAHHFSREDTDAISEQMREDKDFMALLVTPEVKLLCGIDNPQLVVDDFPDYAKKSIEVHREIEAAASRLGYDLNRLRATRKK